MDALFLPKRSCNFIAVVLLATLLLSCSIAHSAQTPPKVTPPAKTPPVVVGTPPVGVGTPPVQLGSPPAVGDVESFTCLGRCGMQIFSCILSGCKHKKRHCGKGGQYGEDKGNLESLRQLLCIFRCAIQNFKCLTKCAIGLKSTPGSGSMNTTELCMEKSIPLIEN